MTEKEFCEKYDKYKNTVYSVIFNYLRNTYDTADVHQEVFMKLYQAETEFQSDEHMKAWLIRTAVNLSKNFLRDNKRRSGEELDENIPYLEENEDNGLLAYVLKLPEKYRIPIHLFYYEGYSVNEISDILGIPQGTVKIHLKRGREKLKSVLTDFSF
ncbi:MAG: sigma-70 family RNA polymerase sigma factor [Ruminiclostridium sp.]|nr:sigma-70 family RNA polymerase sigma factor [Ruminiclostridium sp.]